MTLREKYDQEVVPALLEKLKLKNKLAVPRLEKIVLNIGLGEALDNKKVLEIMSKQLALVTGQKPIVTKSRRAIAAFKLRADMPIGLKVTLRGRRMYSFLEKLIRIVLPRLRDFRGLSRKSFDALGNYSLGFSEITVFPEVDYESLDKTRGLQVTVVTTAQSKERGQMFLELLGLPFEKESLKK